MHCKFRSILWYDSCGHMKVQTLDYWTGVLDWHIFVFTVNKGPSEGTYSLQLAKWLIRAVEWNKQKPLHFTTCSIALY